MSTIADLWRARYGSAPPELPAANGYARTVLEQLLAHRSVRAFNPEPLPERSLELMVAAAQSAASSANLQTWSVVAVQDPARKLRLAQLCAQQVHVHVAPVFLVWLADLSRLDRVAERMGREAGANRYLEMFLVAVIDAALAAQNAVLAAESLGLGTVYIGAVRNHADQVAAELKLPPDVFPLFGLCVGRPDEARPATIKPRLAQGVVLHHETYGHDPSSEADQVRAYDEIIQAFQKGQRMPLQPWTSQATNRVSGPDSLSGRHRLLEMLHSQGFALE